MENQREKTGKIKWTLGLCRGHKKGLYNIEAQKSAHMRVVLKVLVFGLYLGDHFSWFKRLAKVSRKKTRKDYTFSRKMCDSSVVQ